MSNMSSTSLQPGQINLSLIPDDWPLTPVAENKNPYLPGWQKKPQDTKEIQAEIEAGQCKAVGLISGPVYNEPYGLVWVDVDGPTVYATIKEVSGLSVEDALPKTLTICSGREGRERKLYKLLKPDWEHFIRNKYCWHAEGEREKLEVLWKRHQGVLMGHHPDTDGYFTKDDEDFAFVNDLPSLPSWILEDIIKKNKRQGKPNESSSRICGMGWAIDSKLGLERTMQEAVEAMWALPAEATDDYDLWITIGQSLHAVDESLLDQWDEWSKQSDKYKGGECRKRWNSFNKAGGIGPGTLYHHAKQYGWQPNQDHRVTNVDDGQLDEAEQFVEKMLNDFGILEMPTTGSQSKSHDIEMPPPRKRGQRNAGKKDVSNALMRMYEGNLLFDPAADSFLFYNNDPEINGLWSTMGKSEMLVNIWHKLEFLGDTLLPNGFDLSYTKDMYETLSCHLAQEVWDQDKNLLLFKNGVYNIEEATLSPPNREQKFRHALRFNYNPEAECPQTIQWLTFTQYGDDQRVQLIRAWMRAVLVSATDIQKFVEVVGPGKTGKSSWLKMCNALVGHENAAVSDLQRLEKNRFGLSGIAGKKLLLFNDVERYGGDVKNLKAITGGDEVLAEHKYGGQVKFYFEGLVMISANEQIATTDATSGLARRRLTIPFDRVYRGNGHTPLIDLSKNGGTPSGKLAPELPGIVNWLLQMPKEEMYKYLLETKSMVDYFRESNTRQLIRTNPIIDWLHHSCIFEPGVACMIGDAQPQKDGNTYYKGADKKLYANYCEFCRNNNVGAQSRSRFENNLMDILNHQLNLNVYSNKKRTRSLINIRIRVYGEDVHYPSIVDLSLDPNSQDHKNLYGSSQITYGSK